MVYFVGAGSGAADLITVRGKNLLEKADVIIYAGSLVNPELLTYAKEDCEIHNSAYMTLDEVITVMENAEKAGKTVVRLHTGEPSIYGAVREQMDLLDEKGITYESCPGVSACFVIESGIHAARYFTVADHHTDGRKDKGATKGKHRKLCRTSGEYGDLFKHGNAGRAFRAADRGRLFGRNACSTCI